MILKILLLFFIYIPLFLAAPTSKDDTEAKIIRYRNTNDGSGNYHFEYETSNGITREETGTLINGGHHDTYIVVDGLVSYLDPNGKLIIVRYSADKKGYHIVDEPLLVTKEEVSPLIVASLLG
ncbi:endocuticle structural glycoprotein SgAbd-5-like [Cydia pomonella]|uniref:endocuticle structural glycoprotein SgAbd-5-like n=1 Tax=Cydia pomonella TaxID=82600 RepID=UPI002ADD4107|nr:endocuticle structural glycoprotein SgAbd-5-like [Cydia pomonella]